MTIWTCPSCDRQFGAKGQGHMCSPGVSVREFRAGHPEYVSSILQPVIAHLTALDAETGGDLIIDPLATKVLFKNGPTFCVLDVKKKWVAVGFSLRRRVESGRLSRKVVDYGGKYYHVVNVDDPAAIDEEMCEWLTEAYHHGDPDAADAFRAGRGDEASPSADPMVPDDIDFDIAPPI